ncbi:glycosyltransferase [Thalassobaculum sp.]|uniref:glycosyltransferase n=1 Tax=Thalassobaculum sp. TaxID=2022740 RepID=UPI0032EF9465
MASESSVTLPAAFAAAVELASKAPVDAAIAAFEGVVARWPSVAVAHANLAVLLRRAGRIDDAVLAFRTAARLDPGDPERHAALANACHGARRMEEAAVALRRQAVLRPGDPDATYNLGVMLPLVGTRADGERSLRRAAVLDPMRPGTWDRLCRASVRLGFPERAVVLVRRALMLAPAQVEAAADLAWLAKTPVACRRWQCIDPGDDKAALALAEAHVAAGDTAGAARALAGFEAHAEPPERALLTGRRAGLPWARAARSRYEQWLAAYEVDDPETLANVRAGWPAPPVITVVVPVCDPPPGILEAAIASVERQSYPHWRLRIADDASNDPAVRAVLAAAAERDPRTLVTWRPARGHISAATNSALATAEGEWVAFLDHDDMLHPHALHHVAAEIVADPAVDLVFSDEDKIDETGSRFGPHFKPDFDPDRVLAQNYVCHLAVYRRALVDRVGGLRVGLEGSQDHDLLLRVMENSSVERVRHLPRALYHWRAIAGSTALTMEAKPYAVAATRRAVAEHLARRHPDVRLVETDRWYRIVRPLPDPPPLASVIVATRDRLELLRRCVDGVLHATDYPVCEVILLDNGSERPETLAWLREIAGDPRVRVLSRPGPFNFSALMNDGAAAARGDVLVFLNNDVEPCDPGWLDELVRQACRPEVGAVGAKLLYPDRTVQHGGVVLAGDYVARHVDVGRPDADDGYLGRSAIVQTMSAVTGACLAIRRDVFEAVGGFDAERLTVDYSDMDLCLRAGAAGYRTLWTPFARLLHHESATRGPYMTAAKLARWEAETAVMRARWGDLLDRDPWYNPNLSIDPEGKAYDLAFPPRPVAATQPPREPDACGKR